MASTPLVDVSRSVTVPFASDAVGAVVERESSHADALRHFGFCFRSGTVSATPAIRSGPVP